MNTATATAPAAPSTAKQPANGNRLNASEKTELGRLEKVLHHHFETFKEAGHALLVIRDKRLYRETHATFEDYCRIKWAMSKTQANRLIAAAKVVENLEKIAPSSITAELTEAAIRPLTGLDAKQQAKVFKQVVATAPPAGGGITARRITQVAREVAPEAFRARPVKPGEVSGRRSDGSDFARKSELLDNIAAWRKQSVSEGKFATLKPDQVLNAVRGIIRQA